MKRIKQYKMFESKEDDFMSEVKECFLPVTDIIYDNLEICENTTLGEWFYILVKIKLPQDNIEELINEIANSIYHCRGYDINIAMIRLQYYEEVDSLYQKDNINLEDQFIKKSLSLLKNHEIHTVYIFLEKWEKWYNTKGLI